MTCVIRNYISHITKSSTSLYWAPSLCTYVCSASARNAQRLLHSGPDSASRVMLKPRWKPVLKPSYRIISQPFRRRFTSQESQQASRQWTRILISTVGATFAIMLFIGIEGRRRRGSRPSFENIYDDRKKCVLLGYKGMFLPPFCENTLSKLSNFVVRESDIYVLSFPKSGTTWVQEIVFLLKNNIDVDKARQSTIEERVPFLEFIYPGISEINKMPSPRVIKTHLPHRMLPKDIIDKKCKVIYIARNPRDVCVSDFHFMNLLKQFAREYPDFESFFRDFVEGKVEYGPWWGHVKDTWEVRNQENVLFLKYEELKKDLPSEIMKIASFLGVSVSHEDCLRVARHCSFQSMKDNPATNYSWWNDIGISNLEAEPFMRKGVVGDWKNYFDKNMEKELNATIDMHLAGTELTFEYEQ